MEKIKIAILGASGYTGSELIRILINHPHVEIAALIANSNSGQKISQLYPHLENLDLPALKKTTEINFSKIDVVFSCLPHTASFLQFKEFLTQNHQIKIIDLSADFRLDDANEYKKWYEHDHQATELMTHAVYGLSEINRHKIKKSSLIACPGCYPTSVLLPLIPLLNNNLIDNKNIIIDSKSGTSGAGRNVKINNLFCEVNESVKAYSIGKHRHIGEIEQELSKSAKQKIFIEFTPHLLPINRGIISTIYTKINPNYKIDDLQNCLNTFYDSEYFVHITDGEPSISNVRGTNNCEIAIKKGRLADTAIIISTIDNLCKGASGQAVQNFNIIFGFAENTALKLSPLFI